MLWKSTFWDVYGIVMSITHIATTAIISMDLQTCKSIEIVIKVGSLSERPFT